MAIQMILCVETNKRADTDGIYISETINHWYVVNNQVKINRVYMNTKSKYNSKDVLREIAKKSKEFVIGATRVIYCVDTDRYECNAAHRNELDQIRDFCGRNQYDLIWFCHDVEEVFWGQKIPDTQKVQKAAVFRRKHMIEEIPGGRLACDEKRACTSNILSVLDKYLTRK